MHNITGRENGSGCTMGRNKAMKWTMVSINLLWQGLIFTGRTADGKRGPVFEEAGVVECRRATASKTGCQ